MRIAVVVIGLVLTLGLHIQAMIILGLSNATSDQNTSQAGAVGVLMAFVCLLSCGLVIPVPRVSVVMFGLAGFMGFAASANSPDLAVWGGISFALAFMSYLGDRGMRKGDRKEAARAALRLRVLAGQRQAGTPS